LSVNPLVQFYESGDNILGSSVA